MLLKRRTFLSASLTVAAGGGLQLLLSCTPDEGVRVQAVIELSKRFSDLESIRRVGRAALLKLPDGTDLDSLIAVVLPQRSPEELRSEIREQYRRGETLAIGDWQIALTEARICALIALSK